MMYWTYGTWGWFGWIGMILWWALIILVIVALVRWIAGVGDRTQRGGKSAREILDERYARGEISKKEFESMREDLTKS